MAHNSYRVTCDGPGCTASHHQFDHDRFARCESCCDDFCRQCAYPGTWHDYEDETGRIVCVCVACGTEDIYNPLDGIDGRKESEL